MMDERNKESLSALMDGEASEIEIRRLLSKENAGELTETWRRFHQVRTVLRSQKDEDVAFDISLSIADAIEKEPPLVMPKVMSKVTPKIQASSSDDNAINAEHDETSIYDQAPYNHVDEADIAVAIATDDRVLPFIDRRGKYLRRASDKEVIKKSSNSSVTKGWKKIGQMAVAASVVLAVVLVWQPLKTETIDADALAAQLFAQSDAQPLLAYNDNLVEASDLNSPERVARLNEYLLRHAENASLRAGQSLLPLARVASYNAAPPRSTSITTSRL